MQTILDLSLLKELPELSAKVTLEIRPLAPLSMVSEMPGSYYKSMKYPDKKMLCGLFENILGWHIDLPLRKSIFEEYKAIREKQKVGVEDAVSGSTYRPLLMDYFSINGKPAVKFESLCFYKDLWNRGYRRERTQVHLDGSRNVDLSLVGEKNALYEMLQSRLKEKELTKASAAKIKDNWVERNMDGIPCYYTIPSRREYMAMEGVLVFSLLLDARLLDMLRAKLEQNNVGYLGTSEGWIDIKLG